MGAKLAVVLAMFGLFSSGLQAAPANAVVEAVQAPAWVERGGQRLPLAPGMALDNRDRLLTGPGARAVVQLADGSALKFGENASVAVNAMQQGRDGVFSAALDVVRGAFRLTTDIFRKYQTQRAINVRTGTVTIGIRGTDLWGRSNDEKDLVCLIEGRIAVSHPLGEAVELDQSLQFYVADKGAPPSPVASVAPDQLLVWAAETELQAQAVTQQRDGRWVLDFGVFGKEGALAIRDQLAAAGYAGRIRPIRMASGYRYEVRLGQLVGEQDARRAAERLGREQGLPPPVVRQR